MHIYGERLKQLREARGLSQERLAEILNTTRSRIGNYERGIRQPDFEMQEAIADFFNVSLDYLFDRDKAMDEQKRRLLAYYEKLSNISKEKAMERLEELVKLEGIK
jgi:transcriptional regulator with XRE-family HTH domain